MKKKLLCIFVFFLLIIPAFSFEFMNISITPEAGITNGHIGEYVFDTKCKNTGNMLSRLDWDIKNIPYIGVDITNEILNLFFLDINFKHSIPKRSGIMQDYDWLNSVTPSWMGADPTELTNYSQHENFINDNYTFSIKAGGIIPVSFVNIYPYAEFCYSYIDMESFNGYRIYKSENWKKNDFNGKVIIYRQDINSIFLGLKLQSPEIKRIKMYADFSFSPFLTFIDCYDFHLLGKNLFWDRVYWAPVFNIDCNVTVNIFKNNFLAINSSIKYIPLSTGDNYAGKLNNYGELNSYGFSYSGNTVKGGTSHFMLSFSIQYTVIF